MEAIIKAKRIDAVPGDTLYAMTKSHTSVDGTRYPAGTEFRPISSGSNNGDWEQTVTVAGKTVTFRKQEA